MLPSCGAAGKLIDHQKMISSCLTLIHGAVCGQKSGIIKQIPHQGFRGKLVCDCAEGLELFLNLHRKSFVRVHQRVIEPGLPASDADPCQLLIAHTKQRTAKHTQKRNILMGIIQYPQEVQKHLNLRGFKYIFSCIRCNRQPCLGQCSLIMPHGISGTEKNGDILRPNRTNPLPVPHRNPVLKQFYDPVGDPKRLPLIFGGIVVPSVLLLCQ